MVFTISQRMVLTIPFFPVPFNDDGELLHIRASRVGENGIKPNVWYSLTEAGEFKEIYD